MTKLADELEALAKDATPGPWEAREGNLLPDRDGHRYHVDGPRRFVCTLDGPDGGGDNALLIVALQNNLGTIIAALRQPDQRHPSVIACEDYFRHLPPVPDAAANHDRLISINETLAAQREEDPLGDGSDYGVTPLVDDKWPDAVPGDLVETAWLGLKARVCSDPSKATRCVMVSRNDLAAAIQSLTAENATLLFKCREAEEGWKNALIAPLTWQAELTAERDALQQALADAQGAMTLTAEIGVTYFDQRNEALARVAELEALVEEADKLLSWMNKHRDASRAVWLDQSSDWIAARALLEEGSKP